MSDEASSWPPTVFIIRTSASDPVVIAEVADALAPSRWASLHEVHPDVLVVPEEEATSSHPAALAKWRVWHPGGRTELIKRIQTRGIVGLGHPTAEERRQYDEQVLMLDELRRRKRLSPRERETTELLLLGLRPKEIAAVFQVGEGAVKMHIMRAYEVLGVATKQALATRFRALDPSIHDSLPGPLVPEEIEHDPEVRLAVGRFLAALNSAVPEVNEAGFARVSARFHQEPQLLLAVTVHHALEVFRNAQILHLRRWWADAEAEAAATGTASPDSVTMSDLLEKEWALLNTLPEWGRLPVELRRLSDLSLPA